MIMSGSQFSQNEVLVDGQPVVIPSIDGWDRILNDAAFEGVPVYSSSTERLVRNLHSFVSTHQEEFSLGIFRPGLMKSWLVIPLLHTKHGYQRVQIERHTCEQCGWKMRIANPVESGLYLGVPNAMELRRSALEIAKLACPSCGSKLSRPAIWIESSDGKEGDD